MTTDARTLLAQIEARRERISAQRHALAREDAALREAATRLRTGCATVEVRASLQTAGAFEGLLIVRAPERYQFSEAGGRW